MKWLCCTKEFGDSQTTGIVASFHATKWRSTMRGRNISEAAAGGGVPAAPGTKQKSASTRKVLNQISLTATMLRMMIVVKMVAA